MEQIELDSATYWVLSTTKKAAENKQLELNNRLIKGSPQRTVYIYECIY
jgi:hypothetical protein